MNFYSVPEAFYPTILCTALKANNESDWFYIYDLALNIHNSAERFSLMGSLTCSNDISLLELYTHVKQIYKQFKSILITIFKLITANFGK